MKKMVMYITRKSSTEVFENEIDAKNFFNERYKESVNILFQRELKNYKIINECDEEIYLEEKCDDKESEKKLKRLMSKKLKAEKELEKISKGRYAFKWIYKNHKIRNYGEEILLCKCSAIIKRNNLFEIIEESFYLSVDLRNRLETKKDQVFAYLKNVENFDEQIEIILKKERRVTIKRYSRIINRYKVKNLYRIA